MGSLQGDSHKTGPRSDSSTKKQQVSLPVVESHVGKKTIDRTDVINLCKSRPSHHVVKGLQQSLEDAQSILEQLAQGVKLKDRVYLEKNLKYITNVLCLERPIIKSHVTFEHGLASQMQGNLPICGLVTINKTLLLAGTPREITGEEIFDISDHRFVKQIEESGSSFIEAEPMHSRSGDVLATSEHDNKMIPEGSLYAILLCKWNISKSTLQ